MSNAEGRTMSEPKFTKGPWYCENDDFIGGAALTSEAREGMTEIAAVSDAFIDEDPCDLDGFEAEQLANAHLIAAAPEMYEMLQSLLDAQGTIHHPTTRVTINRLLAKARGESNE